MPRSVCDLRSCQCCSTLVHSSLSYILDGVASYQQSTDKIKNFKVGIRVVPPMISSKCIFILPPVILRIFVGTDPTPCDLMYTCFSGSVYLSTCKSRDDPSIPVEFWLLHRRHDAAMSAPRPGTVLLCNDSLLTHSRRDVLGTRASSTQGKKNRQGGHTHMDLTNASEYLTSAVICQNASLF